MQHDPHLRRSLSTDDFDQPDSSTAQGLLLDGVARGGLVTEIMPRPLKLDGVERTTFRVNDQQVDPLGINGKERILAFAGQDFAKTDLRHRPPSGTVLGKDAVDNGKQTSLGLIEQ